MKGREGREGTAERLLSASCYAGPGAFISQEHLVSSGFTAEKNKCVEEESLSLNPPRTENWVYEIN